MVIIYIYIITKIRTYGDKIYTNFHGLNRLGDDVECESFTVISNDSLLADEKNYYLQVYLDSSYKIPNTQVLDNLDDNLCETYED